MAAPQILDLATIMAQLDPAYSQSRAITQQQIDAIPGQTQQQIQGLDTAKSNAFIDVNNNANSKGMAFSGVPAAEQTRYLGEKYLPAVANVQSTANTNRLSLQQQLASLYQDQYSKALGTRQQQQQQLDAYNADQAKMAFQAQQAALDRSASAAGRAADQPTADQMRKADIGALHSELSKVTGRDGFVSPTSYAQAKSLWVSNGYSSKDFDSSFSAFRNPKNKAYKLG